MKKKAFNQNFWLYDKYDQYVQYDQYVPTLTIWLNTNS